MDFQWGRSSPPPPQSQFPVQQRLALLRAAMSASPHPTLARSLAETLLEAKQPDEALSVLQTEDCGPAGTLLLAAVQLHAGLVSEALQILQSSPAGTPDEGSTLLAECLLRHGDAAGALEACDRALAANPFDSTAHALRRLCQQQLGPAEPPLPESLIQSFDVDVPEALRTGPERSQTLLAHPALEFVPKTSALQVGTARPDFVFAEHDPLGALLVEVKRAVSSYVERLPFDEDAADPFLRLGPSRASLSYWVTVVDRGGHHPIHHHKEGWVSGVLHLCVPEDVRSTQREAGWLHVGVSPKWFSGPRSAHEAIRPVEGRVVIFPSHYFHRTVPTCNDSRRVSLAFDVVPAGRAP